MTDVGNRVQVKICGLTRVEEALACAELGADAVGCVFFPKSPRFVDDWRAREICAALPAETGKVGVFVNEDYSSIMRRVEQCGINGVQLHGQEAPELVKRLRGRGLIVIKALFVNAEPGVNSAALYDPSAFLVEAAGGPLPGGNALAWDRAAVGNLRLDKPLLLAGGLHVGNVAAAIALASPHGVDVSSGVEAQPGRKDLDKVREFLRAVHDTPGLRELRKIF